MKAVSRLLSGVRSLSTFHGLAPVTKIRIHEVTPRDGLQNEKSAIPVEAKVRLVESLIDCGFKSIELCSFVREDLVPQMKGSQEMCNALAQSKIIQKAKKNGEVRFAALVPNLRGYQTVQKVNHENKSILNGNLIDSLVVLTSCTETHSKRNVNMTITEALNRNEKLVEAAKSDGVKLRAYASLAFGCPFEGKVDPKVVQKILIRYIAMKVDEVVLADTFGNATPDSVRQLLEVVFTNNDIITEGKKIDFHPSNMSLHMHDANGLADKNIEVSIKEFGISYFDSAIGGCGGCNFIENAEGNIPTEKLLSLANRMGLSHGIDENKLLKTNRELGKVLGRNLLYSDSH